MGRSGLELLEIILVIKITVFLLNLINYMENREIGAKVEIKYVRKWEVSL